jgi:hypothetical protein
MQHTTRKKEARQHATRKEKAALTCFYLAIYALVEKIEIEKKMH